MLTQPEITEAVPRDPLRAKPSAEARRRAPLCLCAGTPVLTARGYRPVEQIRPGDLIVTWLGAQVAVVWAGRRRLRPALHPAPDQVRPIRIQADALGERLPDRDLLLSPNAALVHNGVLTPVPHFLNGASVAQAPGATVDYIYLELASRAVLIVADLPVECVPMPRARALFANTDGAVVVLHPDFGAPPSRAPVQGPAPVAELPPLRARADGRALSVTLVDARTYRIRLPRREAAVQLCFGGGKVEIAQAALSESGRLTPLALERLSTSPGWRVGADGRCEVAGAVAISADRLRGGTALELCLGGGSDRGSAGRSETIVPRLA